MDKEALELELAKHREAVKAMRELIDASNAFVSAIWPLAWQPGMTGDEGWERLEQKFPGAKRLHEASTAARTAVSRNLTRPAEPSEIFKDLARKRAAANRDAG